MNNERLTNNCSSVECIYPEFACADACPVQRRRSVNIHAAFFTPVPIPESIPHPVPMFESVPTSSKRIQVVTLEAFVNGCLQHYQNGEHSEFVHAALSGVIPDSKPISLSARHPNSDTRTKSRTDSPTTPHPVAPTTKSLPRPLDRLQYRSYSSFPLIHDAIRVGLQVIIFFISNFYGLSTHFITWTLLLLYLSFADPFYL